MNKNVFSFYTLMDIRFADPISAIGMTEKYIVIGSMMGRIASLNLPEKKVTLLAELSTENITGITFESGDTFNVAIGDEEVLKYKFAVSSSGQTVPDYLRLKNYPTEELHSQGCDKCFTILSTNYLAFVYLNQPNENIIEIQMQPTTFKVKNILSNAMDEYTVQMSNYSVPFDFDGTRLAWVEFLSEKERNVCIYYVAEETKWTFAVDKSFGHISHLKLMPNKKVFLVRNLNQCEVRDTDKDFKVVHKFTHLGDEVIAVDYYVNSSKILLNDMELENVQVGTKKNDQYIKVPLNKNNLQVEDKNQQEEQVNENSHVSEDNISIYLLDIDGNFNVWENFSLAKMFNLYDMKDISQDCKNKQFFSMGYPYYIKANMNYYAISSDHGVFVVKKGSD